MNNAFFNRYSHHATKGKSNPMMHRLGIVLQRLLREPLRVTNRFGTFEAGDGEI
ncbi:MAG: hypothetical protein ABSH15_05810 [Verrucomicrobiota bacterium]|jgi:hypothetical protein